MLERCHAKIVKTFLVSKIQQQQPTLIAQSGVRYMDQNTP